jgi:hypothetical protein
MKTNEIVKVTNTLGLSQDVVDKIESTMVLVKEYIDDGNQEVVELENSKGQSIVIFPYRIEKV